MLTHCNRDQLPLRPRRESRLGANIYNSYRSSPPKPSTYRYEAGGTPAHRQRAGYNLQPGSDGEEEVVDARDTTPLLATTKATEHKGIYGSSSRPQQYRRPSSRSTTSSNRRFGNQNREQSWPGASPSLDYDVNNPPSVPGSPKVGAEMGYDDVMVGGFAQPRTPDGRHEGPQGNDIVIDIDDQEQDSETRSSRSPRLDPSEMSGRRRITLPAEEDVCFPTEGMSEIAEEEYVRNGQAEATAQRRRRRRMWPDLSILEEWSREEKEERSEGIRALRVSETVLVGGRLRPNKFGWHRTE